MKEYMLLIRNQGEATTRFSPDKHLEFVRSCESYIGRLKNAGKLIAAQPLVREGSVITGSEGAWKTAPVRNDQEIQVGYYHILADDLDDAIAIAKENPEFQYTATARIEVRPIKMKEEKSGFVYPGAKA